jgi:hypothetical protein
VATCLLRFFCHLMHGEMSTTVPWGRGQVHNLLICFDSTTRGMGKGVILKANNDGEVERQ